MRKATKFDPKTCPASRTGDGQEPKAKPSHAMPCKNVTHLQIQSQAEDETPGNHEAELVMASSTCYQIIILATAIFSFRQLALFM
jgi:hypothetical protein